MSSLDVFFGKILSLLFWQKGNFIFVGKRSTIFTERTENIIFPISFFFCCFFCFEKDQLSFSDIRKNVIFSGKRNAIFPDDRGKITFQCNFLERPPFQNIWKKKIWFFVEWYKVAKIYLGYNITIYFQTFIDYVLTFIDYVFMAIRKGSLELWFYWLLS